MGTAQVGSRPASRRPLLVGGVVVALATLVSLPLFAGPWLGAEQKASVVDVAAPAAALVAALLLARRGLLSPTAAARRSWFLLAAGWTAFLVGDLMWSYVHFFTELGHPPLAEGVYVAGSLLCLAGLVVFPVTNARDVSRTRLLLDAVVVASAVTLIAFMLLIQDIFASVGTGLAAAANAFHPGVDLLMVLVVLLLLMRSANRRLDLVLIGAGFASLLVADLSFAVGLLHQGPALTTLASEPPYLLGPMLLALAALAPADDPRATVRRKHQGVLLPDLAVLAALLTLAARGIDGWGVGVLALITMALAVTRQVWLATENHRLHRCLERRVAARTAEAEGLAQRQRRILQSVGEGIVGIDGLGRLSFANQTAEQLLGAAPGSLVGRNACHALHGQGAHDDVGCTFVHTVTGGEPLTSTDEEFTRADGTCFPVDLTATPHQDVTDPSVAVVAFRDITERRATEKLKSEFVSIVSHELRTPLTSIRGSLDLLADGDLGELDAGVVRVVGVARRASERLTRLINDILEMERLETGTLPMQLADEPAAALTESAMSALVPIAEVEGIVLKARIAPCSIRVDADRYAQVITNLVGNAVKFTPRGGSVQVDLVADDAFATVSVTDTGRGIPPDEVETVFARFHQVEASDHNVGAGSGLGLAISRSIVEAHGGVIWAESEPGRGAIFRFTIPRKGAPAPAEPADEPAEEPVSVMDEEHTTAG